MDYELLHIGLLLTGAGVSYPGCYWNKTSPEHIR